MKTLNRTSTTFLVVKFLKKSLNPSTHGMIISSVLPKRIIIGMTLCLNKPSHQMLKSEMEGDHLDIVEGRGPGLEKLKDLTRNYHEIIPDLKYERKATILHEDSVIVLSTITGTVQNMGKRFKGVKENEINLFPGTPQTNSWARGL